MNFQPKDTKKIRFTFPVKEAVVIGVPCLSLIFLLFSSINFSSSGGVAFVIIIALFIIMFVVAIFRIGMMSAIAFSIITLVNFWLIAEGAEHGYRSFGGGMATAMWSFYIFFPFFVIWFLFMTILNMKK